MIMDGNNFNAGAVGAIRRISNAISVARKVMENTFHTFLVGELATQFALSNGFSETSLATDRSTNIWAKWDITKKPDFTKLPTTPADADHNVVGHDTIGMVALDKNGSIACGTSTNGAYHKIPGRVGDAPIVGSGAYCETGVGGATATGDGD